jgi:hypothetical protein
VRRLIRVTSHSVRASKFVRRINNGKIVVCGLAFE